MSTAACAAGGLRARWIRQTNTGADWFPLIAHTNPAGFLAGQRRARNLQGWAGWEKGRRGEPEAGLCSPFSRQGKSTLAPSPAQARPRANDASRMLACWEQTANRGFCFSPDIADTGSRRR